jgi:hypothetical protein
MIFLFLLLSVVVALREDPYHPLVVDYHEHYNYKHLKDKIVESMSVNNCSVHGDVVYGAKNTEYVTVKEVPPPKNVLQKWVQQNKHLSNFRIFAHVSSNMCKAPPFRDAAKGFYKRAKGCYKVYMPDKNGITRKRFNDYGATLHPEHVRCDNQVIQNVCNSGPTGMHVIDKQYRELGAFPFVVTAKEVTIGRGGMFALPCGPFGLFSSCEAVKCGIPEAVKTMQNLTICRNNVRKCPYPVYEKVFIMTQYDDTQIGQFMQEALPKLIYHLEFLWQHPEYKIHYGFTKKPTVPNFVLPHHFFAAFGLLDRLINGTFYAKEVIMPREGGCQDIGYNAWEVVTMREKFYDMLKIHESSFFPVSSASASGKPKGKPVVLILTRSAGKFTQNKYDANIRSWSPDQLRDLQEDLKVSFPNHTLDIFSDTNATLMTCPLCQAEKFSRADVVIGYHGAGLSNAMFMRPGSVLVEVIAKFDSRHIPIIGIFPRVSDIIGLHHFSYYKDPKNLKNFDIHDFVTEIADFYKKSKLWMFT